MKKVIIILFLLPILTYCQSKKVESALTQTIAELKARSMNSDKVDWDVLSKEAFRLAENAKDVEDLGPSIRYLFKSLNDFHGFFRYKDSTFSWIKERRKLAPIYKPTFAEKGNKFFTRDLDGIGYLRIPTTTADVAIERTKALQDSLCKILNKNPAGLIFDLRLNGGGHVMSMVAGISNILQYGPVSPGDEIRKDGYYRDGKNIHVLQEKCNRDHLSIPLVVIVGPVTASSAEMLTIILKTRPNTVVVGEPTAGAITGVYGLVIDKKINLGIAIGYMTDIKGKAYTEKIQPDILVDGGDDFKNLLADKKVSMAIQVIRKSAK